SNGRQKVVNTRVSVSPIILKQITSRSTFRLISYQLYFYNVDYILLRKVSITREVSFPSNNRSEGSAGSDT
ncbi:hypothetical protein GOODEAATRI_011477, partial [Goodea atripinnis]